MSNFRNFSKPKVTNETNWKAVLILVGIIFVGTFLVWKFVSFGAIAGYIGNQIGGIFTDVGETFKGNDYLENFEITEDKITASEETLIKFDIRNPTKDSKKIYLSVEYDNIDWDVDFGVIPSAPVFLSSNKKDYVGELGSQQKERAYIEVTPFGGLKDYGKHTFKLNVYDENSNLLDNKEVTIELIE